LPPLSAENGSGAARGAFYFVIPAQAEIQRTASYFVIPAQAGIQRIPHTVTPRTPIPSPPSISSFPRRRESSAPRTP
jgi:hypothetical protein